MSASLKPPGNPAPPKRFSLLGPIAAWRARRRASPAWTVAVAAIFGLALLPVAAIAVLAISPTENIWPHLLSTVLPRSFVETVGLMAGVAVVTLIIGAGTAWLVTMYRFPARNLVDWLLVVPLAMPTYIIAFCYVEMLDYSGPLQSSLRVLFGWQSMRDYWFPEIRSLGGTIFVMSAVLYPYVYLSARASFVQQSVCTLEVARTLGRTPVQTFWSVALPLARPALVAGTALALMECLNDIGAVQLLGVRTLTSSVYTTWLERSNLGGAAQIAGVMLIMVLVIFAVERRARGSQRYHHTTGRFRAIAFSDLEGWRGWGCSVPLSVAVRSWICVAGRDPGWQRGAFCTRGACWQLRQLCCQFRAVSLSCSSGGCRCWFGPGLCAAGGAPTASYCRPCV